MANSPARSPLSVPTGLAQALMRLADHADGAAWELIVREAGPHLWRIAYRLSSDIDAADDALQEAMLQVRDHASDFRHSDRDSDRAALRWMMSISAHAVIGIHRRRVRRREQPLSSASSLAAPSTGMGRAHGARQDELDSGDFRAQFREELGRLPPILREPVILHYISGLTLSEIAITLGITIGNAKIRLHRGLRRLRALLVRTRAVPSLLALDNALVSLPQPPPLESVRCLSLLRSARIPSLPMPIDPLPVERSVLSKFALLAAVSGGICLIPVVAGQEALANAGHARSATTSSDAPEAASSESADSARSCWSFDTQASAAERTLVASRLTQRQVNCMDYDGTLCKPDGQLAEVLGLLFQLNGFKFSQPASGLADKHIHLHLQNYSLGDALDAISKEAQLRFVYAAGAFHILDLRGQVAPEQRSALTDHVTPRLKGLVVAVAPNPAGGQDLVTLNVGSTGGAEEKREFYITRGSRYICKVIADRTTSDQTICHAITEPGNIQHVQIAPGDAAIGVISSTATHGR